MRTSDYFCYNQLDNLLSHAFMTQYPDLSEYGYVIHRELGRNRQGGRVTFLATEQNSQISVVIKLFQFGDQSVTWTDYKYIEQEAQILKQLDHPNIPNYLDVFEYSQGHGLVQEYIAADSLSRLRSFTPEQIRQITISVLETLIYIQKRLPMIIHRDIKPSNLLWDESGNVYLVDFGLSRIGSHDISMSSVIAGTLGFMPPEQQFNHPLTKASDLFGLGVTLICLITGTPENKVTQLLNLRSNEFQFRETTLGISQEWLEWLKTMVKPDPKDRFDDAEQALLSLLPLEIMADRVESSPVLASLSSADNVIFKQPVDPIHSRNQKLDPSTFLDSNYYQTSSQKEKLLIALAFFKCWVLEVDFCKIFSWPEAETMALLNDLARINLVLQGRLLDWKISDEGLQYLERQCILRRKSKRWSL